MTTRIGIDFGTANTVVAHWDEATGTGTPVPLDGVDLIRPAGRGITQRVVPSLVAYSHHDERRWVGAQVTAQLRADPGVSVFRSAKSTVTGRVTDIPRAVGGRRITARQAAATFLTDVMTFATLAVDGGDLEIVATAPVESFDPYRDWLVQEIAGELGQARLRVVDEATAAAVGYSARMRPGDAFCVVDFGAGTLDITVALVVEPTEQAAGPGARIVAKAGLDLGGNHIDALLAERAVAAAGLPAGDAVAHNRLFNAALDAAEAAKVALAHADRAVVAATDPVTGAAHHYEITRAGFESLLRERDVLGRVNRALRRALDQAAARGYPADAIAGVFLVGGSCLIPAVQELIGLQFDPEVIHLDRPLEAVAIGAAAVAGGRELHDHVQHDYCIRHVDAGGYDFEVLVAAGTPYPSTRPVKSLTIRAIRDGQRRLGLPIYERTHATVRSASAPIEIMFDAAGGARTVAVTPQQEQERSMIWLNEESPTFLVADPPARRGTDRFRLEFHIDAQKRLVVSAFDLHRKIYVLDRTPVVQLA